ncbi:MAG: hypothetical protein FJ333_06490 [Sphingomonadales bacterium]|nr:hypothetical protein [Sphingomonadales bacterium]
MKMRVKRILFGLVGVVSVGAKAQTKTSLSALVPVLKTQTASAIIEKQLLQQGFVLKTGGTGKERVFQGLVDSGAVVLTLRKTSKKGPVWGYRLVFVGEQQTWLQKKADFDQRLAVLNMVLEQSPSNSTKTLPQWCAGKEAQCFQDGVAKYQSGWYWNNAIQRIKTVELKVNNQFETVLEITDNALETQSELN